MDATYKHLTADLNKELIIHAQEEIQQTQALAEQINFLGGVPTTEVERRLVSATSLEMLQQDPDGETHPITRHKERIAQAEALREYGLRRILEEILLQKEEHKRDLLSALDAD